MEVLTEESGMNALTLPFRNPGIAGIVIAFVFSLASRADVPSGAPSISAPPDSFFEKVRERDRDAARAFYKKYIDIGGIPVAASAEVADEALERTHEIVGHLLAGRADVVEEMVRRNMYLIIIGKDQLYTDMPEYRNSRNKDYLNERVRGTGGNPTSFGEENLLSLPLDRYDDESIAVHEFCHTIDSALRSIDPTWRERKNAVYESAMAKGLYRNAYASTNPGEYWAEICQSYFDSNRVNNWNHGPVGTREQLKIYDPEGYELVRTTFRLSPKKDWRYAWLQKLPNVEAPPAKFAIDPYYTKFTWAREFSVVGRKAADASLLAANEVIRKLFAYRHDILKALIARGVKLVVLGREERLADLPELRERETDDASSETQTNEDGEAVGSEVDLLSRFLEYDPEQKLLVVGEEDLSRDPHAALAGSSQLVRVFAGAIHRVAGMRPIDRDWENRSSREQQQYELRVTRLDARFHEKLGELYDAAMTKGAWRGTAAVHDRGEYWIAGVLAYFDAAGQEAAPEDAAHPITTREALEEYDAGLFDLVRETMAYEGHVDWRYGDSISQGR